MSCFHLERKINTLLELFRTVSSNIKSQQIISAEMDGSLIVSYPVYLIMYWIDRHIKDRHTPNIHMCANACTLCVHVYMYASVFACVCMWKCAWVSAGPQEEGLLSVTVIKADSRVFFNELFGAQPTTCSLPQLVPLPLCPFSHSLLSIPSYIPHSCGLIFSLLIYILFLLSFPPFSRLFFHPVKGFLSRYNEGVNKGGIKVLLFSTHHKMS